MIVNLTAEQIELVRHAVGFDGRSKTTYRNHFVTGPGSKDFYHWVDLVNKGYAYHRSGTDISGGDDVFWVKRETALAVRKKDEHLSRDWVE